MTDEPQPNARSVPPWPRTADGAEPTAGGTATALAPLPDAGGDPTADQPAWAVGGAGTSPRYSTGRLVAVLLAVAVGVYFLGPYAFLVIGALVVSVVLHELGHFLTARRTGMKATEFFLGVGPRLWSFRRGEVEYGLKAFPIAAYVRIIGMNNLEEVDPDDEARAFRAQTTWKRMAVVLAGPAMNLLLAFVLLFGVFAVVGKPASDLSTWTVAGVVGGSAADQAGVRVGDRIVGVNGQQVGSFDDFGKKLNDLAGQPVALEVERDGQRQVLDATLRWRLSSEAAAAIPSDPPLTRQDLVQSVDGRPVADYAAFRAALTQGPGEATIRIDRATHPYELRVTTPVAGLPQSGGTGFLGVRPAEDRIHGGPVTALGQTFQTFGEVIGGTVTGLGRLFTPAGLTNYAQQFAPPTTTPVAEGARNVLTPVEGSPALSSLSTDPESSARPVSIIGIVKFGSASAEAGLYDFLVLIALVNIALGLINLIPLLPFDGGHAAIAAYEGVKGRLLGRPYRIDIAKTKLLPLSYGVFLVFLLMGVSAMFLDITQSAPVTP